MGSMYCFHMYSAEDAVKWFARLGFKTIDVLHARPHLLYPQDYSKEEVKKFSELVDSYGLKVVSVTNMDGTSWLTMLHPNAKVRKWMVDHFKYGAEMASMLGAKVIQVMSGEYLAGTPRDVVWRWAKEGLVEVARAAREYGVVLGIEQEAGNAIETATDTKQMIEEIGMDNVRALLDVGHSMVTFWSRFSRGGLHPVDAVYHLKDYLVHVHLHDNHGLVDEHLVPGTGLIDFEGVIKALYDIGYNGYAVLEPAPIHGLVRDPVKACKDSVEYLKKFIKP